MIDNGRVEKYFAAANSYRGFISYFETIFKPDKYEKIYVLKGGPGTGKSSLMKSVEKAIFNSECTKITEIYCSSDPNSLDGIIIEKENKKIAVLDGTAPHERDAVIAGAVDVIVDLAKGLEQEWIIAKREEIIALNNDKKNAYKTAYSYLSIAGEADKVISEFYRRIFDKNKAKNKAEEIFSSISKEENAREDFWLISSFGRMGSYRLDTLQTKSKRRISVSGDEIAASLLLEEFSKHISCNGVSFTRFICPKNPDNLDGIYLPDCSLSIVRNQVGDVYAEDFLAFNGYDKERIKVANMIKNEALEEAKRWFSIASDLHFRLEDIYVSSMNFDKNDEIIFKIIEEIKNIFEIKI